MYSGETNKLVVLNIYCGNLFLDNARMILMPKQRVGKTHENMMKGGNLGLEGKSSWDTQENSKHQKST